VYSKDDARIAFENIGITVDSDLSNLKPSIAEQIKDIVAVEASKEDKATIRKTRRNKIYKDEL
jgi:GTP:adenosylcobinamide-phosphate guanylyltransferase